MQPSVQQPVSVEEWRQWRARGSQAQRVEYWNDVICQAVLDVDMAPITSDPDKEFFGSINSLNQVGARFVNFKAAGHTVNRTRKLVARADDQHLMIGLQRQGSGRLAQGGREITLSQGDIGIIDSGSPFQLIFPEAVDRRIVLMPKQMLAARLRSAGQLREPRKISASFVLSPVIAQLIESLTKRSQPISDSYANVMLEGIADYLAHYLGREETPPGEALSRMTFDRVLDYVSGNLASRDLNAVTAATFARISVRTLHRLFRRFADLSFEQYVIEKRLLVAKQSLASGASATVSDAAFAAGFSDLSHFSRRFTACFGVRPSDVLSKR